MAKVTEVRVRKQYEEGKIKAIVSVTLDDQFVVHGIKIIENDEDVFVAMPSKKLKDGNFKDVFHPISISARENFQEEVLALYEMEKQELENSKEEVL